MGDIEPSYTLYKKFEQNGKVFYRVPRYALGNYSELINKYPQLVKGYSEIKESIEFKENAIEFNDSQKSTIEKTVEMLNKELGAFIVAATGEGKSVMAIRIASLLGMKTLILVHKNFLMEQWKENILKYTGLKENEIGLLKQGKFVDGKIVLGSMQSLMRDTIDNTIKSEFGLVICDEAHRIGAKMFLRSFTRFNPKFRLALSATNSREDGMEKLYYYHLSSNLIIHSSSRNVGSDYYVVEYEREKAWKWYPSYIPFKIRLINDIITDEVRNALLLEIINKCLQNNRSVLVLSERIAQLKFLMDETVKTWSSIRDINVIRFFGALTKRKGKTVIVTEKGIVDPSRSQLNSGAIVFGTYSKVKEGVDVPHLDTLIFATPFSSRTTLIQTKGRIERFAEEKKKPVVIDIYDTDKSLLIGMYKKRERLYKELNMHRILLFDDIK
jgi:superfamily II DNA or RNA helicase